MVGAYIEFYLSKTNDSYYRMYQLAEPLDVHQLDIPGMIQYRV